MNYESLITKIEAKIDEAKEEKYKAWPATREYWAGYLVALREIKELIKKIE